MKHQQSHPLFIFNTPILCVFIPETQIFKTLYLHVCHQIQIPSNPFCSWFPIQSPFKSTYFQNPADNGHPGGLLAEVEAIEASAVLGDVYPHDAYTSRLQQKLLQDWADQIGPWFPLGKGRIYGKFHGKVGKIVIELCTGIYIYMCVYKTTQMIKRQF